MNCALAVRRRRTALLQSNGLMLVGLSPFVPDVQLIGGAISITFGYQPTNHIAMAGQALQLDLSTFIYSLSLDYRLPFRYHQRYGPLDLVVQAE